MTLFLKAKSEASKEDNLSWKQAMSDSFKEENWKVAVKEIETLESMDVREVVDRTDDMNVIDSIWAFKLKRFPEGMVKKFKARFCARGNQQLEGVDFFLCIFLRYSYSSSLNRVMSLLHLFIEECWF